MCTFERQKQKFTLRLKRTSGLIRHNKICGNHSPHGAARSPHRNPQERFRPMHAWLRSQIFNARS